MDCCNDIHSDNHKKNFLRRIHYHLNDLIHHHFDRNCVELEMLVKRGFYHYLIMKEMMTKKKTTTMVFDLCNNYYNCIDMKMINDVVVVVVVVEVMLLRNQN
jgi:hypothetical protein